MSSGTKLSSPTSPLPHQPPTSTSPSPTPLSAAASASHAAANNICTTCNTEIKENQFIRVGAFKFHKDHFLCSVCNVSLHGGKFHHKDGAFYCATHYMDRFCHTCRQCGQKIGTGSMIQAFGHYYHPQHFVCHTCGCEFVDGKYFESGEYPYCELHFQELTLERCAKCSLPVTPDETVKVGGSIYHAACLQCSFCGCALGGKGSLFQKEGRLFCQDDYMQLYCKRCTRCGEYISKNCITVNSEYYHPACLQCDVCDKQLEKYICVNGHLRCSEHADVKGDLFECDKCKKDIDEGDDVVRAVGRKFHNYCFTCQYCNKQLDKATVKVKDKRVCCPECLSREQVTAGATAAAEKAKAGKGKSHLTVVASRSQDEHKTPDSGRRSASSATSSRKSTRSTSTSAAPTPSAPPIPQKIEWKKGDLIGKGSFGKVYMGMNIVTGELIAVKQVRLLTSEELEQATAIQNEIALMENLRHPNIVCFLGTQRSGNKLNILMEFVPGKSLDSILEKFGALGEKVIRLYTRQLLEALAYCHANHVVHRDIKGKNILIDTKGNLKLADFGSAKRFQNVMSKDAPSLSYNYTPLWTAPEVLVGDYNSKVDVWSLGCVIIEMAAAKPPWSEQNFENPFRALYHIGNSDSIPAIPDTLSEEGKAFVRQCLIRDPDLRPTAAEMLKHDWVQGLDVEAIGGLGSGREGEEGSEEDSDREFDSEDEEDEEDEAEETKSKR